MVAVFAVSVALAALLQGAALLFLPWWIAALTIAVLASSLLAQRSLHEHVAAVRDGLLGGGLPAGRDRLRHIVGRDTELLDEAAVARAAIESLAENFSDAVVAPAVWFALLGLPGAAAYKAVNTADSMIGHDNERFRNFGRFAARLDDLVNLPASRLGAVWIVLAAATIRGATPLGALKAVWRDASRHRSPNAGWPEAAMAGALGLRLAGPRQYPGAVRRRRMDGRRTRKSNVGRYRESPAPLSAGPARCRSRQSCLYFSLSRHSDQAVDVEMGRQVIRELVESPVDQSVVAVDGDFCAECAQPLGPVAVARKHPVHVGANDLAVLG